MDNDRLIRIQQPMFVNGKYNELTARDVWRIFENSIDPNRGQGVIPILTPNELMMAQQQGGGDDEG